MRGWRRALIVTGIFMLACLLSPALAGLIGHAVSAPALRAIAKLTGKIQYPVLGLLIGLVIALSCLLKPRVLAAALALVICFNVLWYPLCLAGPETPKSADEDAVLKLCTELISDLNANGRQTISVDEALALSKDVMGAPAAAKAARYPEWMRALRVAGMFIPFTAEAFVDATRNAIGIPFTAAHELAHMMGVADEAEANFVAYERSVSYGGAFAYSAQLWALRYALARVENPGEVVRALDGGILSDLSAIPSVTGVDGDYGNVVDMLAAEAQA
jgi:hypothetical protein